MEEVIGDKSKNVIVFLAEPADSVGFWGVNGPQLDGNILFGLLKKPSWFKRLMVKWCFGWYYIEKGNN